jgi:hypothetical protein
MRCLGGRPAIARRSQAPRAWASSDSRSGGGAWRLLDRLRPVARLAAPPVAQLVQTQVDGDPVDPGAEARLGAEARKRAEHLEEGALGQVLGVRLAPQVPVRKVVDRLLVVADQLVEGAPVAGQVAGHQLSVALGGGLPGLLSHGGEHRHVESKGQGDAHMWI